MINIRAFWLGAYRLSAALLSVTVVAFVSVPAASEWKAILGVLAALVGFVFILSMYFSKQPGGTQESHLLKQELKEYPPGEYDDLSHHD